jgi:PIN domain nuclease of toxin-antitoxin system
MSSTPERVRDLPLHHRDPIDRMLVAQALVEGLTLVTRDQRLADYGVRVMDA